MFKAIVASLLIAAAWLPAASASGLSAMQSVERQVNLRGEDGTMRTAWVPAAEAGTGDRLRYTTRYTHFGREAGGEAVIAVPVPPAVMYVEGSAVAGSAAVSFSADGGHSFASLEAMPAAVRADEITHIRWTFADGVLPGEAGFVSFEAIGR